MKENIFTRLLSILFIFLGALSTYSQNQTRELDSLKKVYLNTKDLEKKEALLLRFFDLEYKQDSLRSYIDKGLILAKRNKSNRLKTFQLLHFYSNTEINSDTDVEVVLKQIGAGKDTDAIIYLLISSYYNNKDEDDKAEKYLNKLFEHPPKHPKLLAFAYRLRAVNERFYKRDVQKNIVYLKKAIEVARKGNSTLDLPIYYQDLCLSYHTLQKNDLAMEALQKGLDFADKSTRNYPKLLSLLALKYGDENENEKAIYFLRKTLQAYFQTDHNNNDIADLYFYFAKTFINHQQNDSANVYIQKLKNIKVTEDYQDKYKKNQYLELKAKYHNNFKNVDSVKFYYDLIIPSLNNKTQQRTKILYLYKYGKILTDNNRPREAIVKLKEAEKGLLDHVNLEILNLTYENLYTNYKKLNDTDNALKYLEKHTDIKDSIYRGSLKAKTEEFFLETEAKEKEAKILLLTAENQKKEIQLVKTRNFFIVIISIVGFSITLFYFLVFYRRKKRHEQKIALLDKEREALELKNKLIENISHEIRTPVSVINGYLQLIREQYTNSNLVKKYVGLAANNTKNILTNFNNFLSLTQSNRNELTLHTENKNLNQFLNQLIESLKGNFIVKNIGFYYQCNFNEQLVITFDFDKLQKILTNLISNSLKFSNPQTNIFININVEKNRLSIDVKDEGFGILKEEHELVFNRFYQSKAHKVSGGFGIGLSFVKELTTLLNGTITLESEPNVGSIFKLVFPIYIENIDLYLKPFKPIYIELVETEDDDYVKLENNLPKVLIAEDNVEMTIYLNEILKQNYNTIFVNNGKEALKKLSLYNFDLIISDYKMPIMDGLTLKNQLNEMEHYNHIPFLLLTAYTFKDIKQLKLKFGIQDYIPKPFSYEELITRTQKLLERSIYLKKIKDIKNETLLNTHFDVLIEKIKDTVIQNLANSNFSISDLASNCGYSQKQLGRIVKANTGMTLVQLILEIRLQKAYELILKKKFPTIMEVIYGVGLNNRSYFNKKFEKRFGIKPSELLSK